MGNCPSAEALAAYIDGNLEGAEKERIKEHLASCEDCFETYAESVRFLLDTEAVPEAENVVRFPSKERARNPWWYAAAALLIVGLGLGCWYAFQSALVGPAPTLEVAEVSPDIQGHRIQELVWDYSKYRGGEGGSETDLDRQSFQVGALLVDFHLSAQAGDIEHASDAWQAIGRVVKEAYMEEDGIRILDEATGIKSKELPLRVVAAKAAETEEELGDSVLVPEYLSFGKWVEAGRIAANTEDPTFFERRENRRFLAYALRNREIEPNDEVRRELQEIARIWDQGNLDPKDFESLAERFQAILGQYDFLS